MELLPRYWPDNVFDVFTMGAARSALDRRKPRVLYIGLGETDEWGHGRRYDLYLDAAHKADRFLAETWAAAAEGPAVQGQDGLLITTDHGRGSTRADWTDHGKKVPGAEFIWIAVHGAGHAALRRAGERRGDAEPGRGHRRRPGRGGLHHRQPEGRPATADLREEVNRSGRSR